MNTSVLIESTSQPLELNCNSAELTGDSRDDRQAIDRLIKDFHVDPHVEIEDEIRDAKDRIYATALSGDFQEMQAGADYARKLEADLAETRSEIASQRTRRLDEIYLSIKRYFADNFDIDGRNGSIDYFVSDLDPSLLEPADSHAELPFLHGAERDRFIEILINQTAQRLNLDPEYGDQPVLAAIVRELPVPVYGSKPEDLQPLLDLLMSKVAGGGTAIGAVGYASAYYGPFMGLATATGIVIVWFTKPHFTTLRDETHHWFADWAKRKLGRRDDTDDD
jgi:hypothetical protein